MSHPPAPLAALLAALALGLGGCGSDSEPASESARRAVESSDELPRLAAGWKPYLNSAGGFAFGLPPGWRARDRGTTTLVRSYDRLVSVLIDPDRTSEALELPLDAFAERVLAALPAYEGQAAQADPRPFPHRYEAVAIDAEGAVGASGVSQRLEVVVIRRPHLATFTVAINANADIASAPATRIAELLVETLRSRPIGAAS